MNTFWRHPSNLVYENQSSTWTGNNRARVGGDRSGSGRRFDTSRIASPAIAAAVAPACSRGASACRLQPRARWSLSSSRRLRPASDRCDAAVLPLRILSSLSVLSSRLGARSSLVRISASVDSWVNWRCSYKGAVAERRLRLFSSHILFLKGSLPVGIDGSGQNSRRAFSLRAALRIFAGQWTGTM